MIEITNKISLDKALEKSNHDFILIFKHSNSCPSSGESKTEVEKFAKKVKIPIYLLIIQDYPELSKQVEEVLEVKHESPQIIFIHQSHSKKVLNHEDVTEDNLFEAMMKLE